jgi:16S rRNA processing protein RimM
VPDLLEVGTIGRAHGLAGEVSVRMTSDRPERVAPGAVLESDRGPLVVRSARRHQDRWIVRFDGVDGRTAAESLLGVVLRGEPIDDPDALFVHELVGSHVIDAAGTDRGVVVAVLSNPASDLLELDGGALVPLVFVVGGVDETDPSHRVIHVEVPDGLFELYD